MRRGLTLAETLVAASVSLLLLALFVPIVLISSRAWRRQQAVQSAQGAILAISYRLRSDYQAARPESLSLPPGPAGEIRLGFLSFQGSEETQPMWNERGEILWRKWVQYRWDSQKHEVRRCEQALATPTREADGLVMPAWQADRSQLVAAGVERFDPAASNPVLLRVEVRASSQAKTSSTLIQALPSLYALDTLGQ